MVLQKVAWEPIGLQLCKKEKLNHGCENTTMSDKKRIDISSSPGIILDLLC